MGEATVKKLLGILKSQQFGLLLSFSMHITRQNSDHSKPGTQSHLFVLQNFEIHCDCYKYCACFFRMKIIRDCLLSVGQWYLITLLSIWSWFQSQSFDRNDKFTVKGRNMLSSIKKFSKGSKWCAVSWEI